jgi:hypothetical protein
MTRWLDRFLSPFRVIGSTTGSRACLCLLISYLAALAALLSVGRQGFDLVAPSPLATLNPIVPACMVLASMLLGFCGAPTFGLLVYPVVLVFYSLFVCRRLHWAWLGVPFALMWLDFYRLVIVAGHIAGC